VSVDLEGARCDEEAARLLPWYVVGRLAPADVERVDRHLGHCAICRTDLAHERELRALFKADARLEYAPQAGLAKTLARIDELGREAPAGAPAAAARRRPAVQWLTAAVVVQAIGLGVLGGAFASRKAADVTRPGYTTLSSGGPSVPGAGHLRAVFAPTLTLAELSGILAARQLTIVGGPSDAGVYTLAASAPKPAAGLDATVAALRSDTRVLFVERAVNDETAAR
jgi:anti-sigma factor RsiW